MALGASLAFTGSQHDLTVKTFSVSEGLSELFTVVVVATSPDPNLDLEDFTGQGAALTVDLSTMDAPRYRTWSGVCSSVQQLEGDATAAGVTTYSFAIRPALWRATLRTNSRIFQHLSAPDIARALLADWRIAAEWKLTRDYPPLAYRAQYQESDAAFLMRLLEDAGIAFTFDNPGAQGWQSVETKLVLTDAPEKGPKRAGTLPYVGHGGGGYGNDHASNAALLKRVRTGKVTLRGDDFLRIVQLPTFVARGGPPTEAPYEEYRYAPKAGWVEGGTGGSTPIADRHGVARTQVAEGNAEAQRLLDALRGTRDVFRFDATAHDLGPGVVMALGDALGASHPHESLGSDVDLLITETTTSGGASGSFVVVVHAVPAARPFRPARRTPKPRIAGVQRATVVGPAGSEIHTDEHGRVKVQFAWDREGKYDAASSCWLRVASPWAGGSFGMGSLPRVGNEVLVAFLDGDPDRPIVVGSVHDVSNHPVPGRLPAHAATSAWKSQSTPSPKGARPGYQEIAFHDEWGKERLAAQAQRELRTLVKHDERRSVGAGRTTTVGHHELHDVGEGWGLAAGAGATVQAIALGAFQATTGGATATLAGDTLRLDARGAISIVAGGDLILASTSVVVDLEGPEVDLNSAGPTPVKTTAAAATPAPKEGGTHASAPHAPPTGKAPVKKPSPAAELKPPQPKAAPSPLVVPAGPKIEWNGGKLYFPMWQEETQAFAGPNRGGRWFGAHRPNGRLHAGCDLFAPVGTPVRAIARGVVRNANEDLSGMGKGFYGHVRAIEILHPGLGTVRYGETSWGKLVPYVKRGQKVEAGDLIGYVGQICGYDKKTKTWVPHPSMHMIHFEYYTGLSPDGPLTVPHNTPYMRRLDLTDPAPLLVKLKELTDFSRPPPGGDPPADLAEARKKGWSAVVDEGSPA